VLKEMPVMEEDDDAMATVMMINQNHLRLVGRTVFKLILMCCEVVSLIELAVYKS
jgi:hypothetical protein